MSTASMQLLADSSQIRTATKDLDRLSASGAGTEKSISSSSEAVKRFNAEMAISGRTVTSTNKVIGFLGKEIESASMELQRLTANAIKSNSVVASIESSMTKLTTASKNAAQSARLFSDTLSSVNSDLSEAKNNIELFISDQIKLGNTIDNNGNVINKNGKVVDALSEDYRRLQAEYLKTSNQVDLLGDAMQDLNAKTDKNQAAAYEARLKQMALADAAKTVSASLKNQALSLNKVETEYSKLIAQSNALSNNSRGVNSTLSNIGRNAGQAGIQVQQFVGQIQGGQSAMLALSQQGADLGFVLGAPLAGAIIGIGASLAGFLLPNIISSSTEISELVERINDLDEAVEKTTAQNRVLAQSNEEEVASLSKRNQQIAEQIELLQERLRLQSTAGTGTDTGQFAVPRSAEENQRRYAESIKETNKELELLRGELDTNNQDIIKFSKSTAELGKNTDVAASKVQGIAQSLQTQIIALQGGAQAAEVYALTQKAIADNTQSQLPTLIELVNQKYELKRAQEAAAESARQEAAAQKELESNYQQFLRIVEQAEQAEIRKAERQLQGFESLKQQIVLQQQQILLENEQYELRRNLLALGDGANQSQIDEITALTEQMQALRFEAELVGASLENSMQNIGLNALDSLSQGLANAITEGESLRDVIGGIANSILNELLTAIIRYAIGSAAQALIGQTTATTAAVTSAATIAAAATPAAIAMNIATLGGAATAAAASSAAAIPTMTGLIASSGIAGFEKGGYTGSYGTKEVAGVVHGQEFVMNARATRQNRGALEAMNRGESMGGNTYVNVVNNATNSNVSTEERQDAQGNRVIDIVVANINQRGKIHKAMTQTTTASNRI